MAGLRVYLGRSLRQRLSALLDLSCLSFLCLSRMLLYSGGFSLLSVFTLLAFITYEVFPK
jgi:hypothetical protein